MTTIFTDAVLLTPEKRVEDATLIASAGGINYAGPAAGAPEVDGRRIDLRGRYLAPGFIDVHVHGGNGITFGSGDQLGEELEAYSHWVAARGVTGFLTSVAMPDHAGFLHACREYADLFDAGVGGAEPLGIHLEGPFLSLEKRATFPADWLRKPSVQEMEEMLEAARGWIKQISLSPELPGAEDVAALCQEAGVVVALGHSNATYEIAAAALAGRWTNVTHTYNAMSGLHHREPGVVGAVLHSKAGFAELIADGVHVHPAAMRLLLERLGSDRVVLITDATLGAGLPDGEHNLEGIHIIVKEGVARIPAGNLAGSTIDMNRCVGNACRLLGVSMADAVRMASTNPARMLGADQRLGRLRAGMDASLVVLEEGASVALTMVAGKIVYENGLGSA